MPPNKHSLLLSTSLTIVVYLLQLRNLYQTHHNHPKTTAITLGSVHSMDLGEMSSEKYIIRYHRADLFPKNPLFSIYSTLHTLTLGNYWSFYCHQSFAFPRMLYNYNHSSVSFQIGFFHLICIWGFSVFSRLHSSFLFSILALVSGCTTVPLVINLLMYVTASSKFCKLPIKLLQTSEGAGYCAKTNFQLLEKSQGMRLLDGVVRAV